MRNEGPFVLEWVSHYIALGFTDIVVAFNDCTDGTDVLLTELDRQGFITAVRNDRGMRGGAAQAAAYRKIRALPVSAEMDWTGVFDADEFLVIHEGDGTTNALLDALPEGCQALSLNWRLFGNTGQFDFTQEPLTERFTACGPPVATKAQAGVKSFYHRSLPIHVVGPHRPRLPAGHDWNGIWLDAELNQVPEQFIKTGWRLSNTQMKIAQVNHYMLRDADTFMVKSWKGRASNSAAPKIKYWRAFNETSDQDHSVLRLKDRRAEALAAMRSSRRVRLAHREAVISHRRLVKELKREPELAQLMKEIRAKTPVLAASDVAP